MLRNKNLFIIIGVIVLLVISGVFIYQNATRDANYYLKKGEESYKKGEFKEARPSLEKATELNEKSYKAHYLLGKTNESLQKLDDALRNLKKASEIKPKNAEVRYNIAIILRSKGKLTQAISELEEAVKLQSNFVGAKLVLAQTYVFNNQTKKAIEIYKDLLDSKLENIDTKQVNLELAKLYSKDNQKKKAKEYIDKVLKIDPKNLVAKKLKQQL